MRRRHELYIACSDTSFKCFVQNLARMLNRPHVQVEQDLEALLRRLFPRLARSPEVIEALLNARVRERPVAPDRARTPSSHEATPRSPRSRRAPVKSPRR